MCKCLAEGIPLVMRTMNPCTECCPNTKNLISLKESRGFNICSKYGSSYLGRWRSEALRFGEVKSEDRRLLVANS